MLDAAVRRHIDPWLDRLGRRCARAGIGANAVTIAGFTVGMLAIALLAVEWYWPALAIILVNRFADGLDGAIARHTGLTDFGGLLDIACDFIFYSGIVLGFALARPENALPAAFLLFAFVGTGTSFLAYAIVAAKRGLTTTDRGPKSLYYLGGLTEGTETIALFIALCVFPSAFAWLAYAFGTLCWLTTATRLAAAWRSFGRRLP